MPEGQTRVRRVGNETRTDSRGKRIEDNGSGPDGWGEYDTHLSDPFSQLGDSPF